MIASALRALRDLVGLARGERNLRVLLASGAAVAIGTGLVEPMLPLYLSSRGLDLERIGLVFTCGSLLPILAQPALGALSDRFNRKTFIVALSFTTSGLLPLLALLKSPLALAAGLGARITLGQSAAPVADALVADVAPAERRASVFGLLDSARTLLYVAMLAGSALVMRLLSPRGALVLAGVVFLLGSASLLFLRDPRNARPPVVHEGSPWTLLRTGLLAPLAYARGDTAFSRLLAYQLCFSFGLAVFPVYLPLYAVQLGAAPAAVGPILAASWLVYAVVQPWGARRSDRSGQRKGPILSGLAGMAILCAAVGLASLLPARLALLAMVAAWVLLAVPDGMFRAAGEALVIDLTPAGERGRFLGSMGSVSAVAGVLAPLGYGLVAQRLGLGAAFLLAAAALLGSRAAIAGLIEPASPPLPLSVPNPTQAL